MSSRPRLSLVSAALLLAAAGCPAAPEPCPPLAVTLPAEALHLPLLSSGPPTVAAWVNGTPAELVLGTGLGRTGVGVAVGDTLDLDALSIEVGSLHVPQVAATGLTGWRPGTGVLGLDVLHTVPLELDARAREVVLSPSFRTDAEGTWVASRMRPDRCEVPEVQDANAARRFEALLVMTSVEGQNLQLILDTGSEATFLRTSVVGALSPRSFLDGVWVRTGLLGTLELRARRVKSLTVADAESPNPVVLTSPQVDVVLDRLSEVACEGQNTCPRLDGILGWNVLRESKVFLDGTLAETGERTLRLERFSSQDHWQRELVGVGIYELRSEDPPGIRVDGFYGRSPAKDAGLLRHDIITRVDGVPALEAPSPFAPPGTQVHLDVLRHGEPLAFDVTVEDLLPDVD